MAALLRRLVPATLRGRLALALVVGLLAAQAISLTLYLLDRRDALTLYSGADMAARVLAIARVVEALPPAERGVLVSGLDGPLLALGWQPAAPAWPAADDAGRVPETAAWRLAAIRAALEAGGLPPDRFRLGPAAPAASRPDLERVGLALALSDGSWLVFRWPTLLSRFLGPSTLLPSILAGTAVVLALALWATRQMTRPLSQLAAAAERFGRAMAVAPIPETGPREVRQAAAAFNRMHASLAGYVEERTRMLAAISHDLRTPIMRMMLRTESIGDDAVRERMLKDLEEMESLIADTLGFARDQQMREPPQAIRLGPLIDDAVAGLGGPAAPVTVAAGPDVAVLAVPLALRRIVGNLAGNAVAYAGGATVRWEAGPETVDLLVEDDGPGIPEAELEAVLEPFRRLDTSRSRRTGGSGLGLAIVRALARAMGGELVLENRAEGGLRARVALPRAGSNS